jgi:hypothetical protein
MAASVLNPGGAIHPVVGSLFSPKPEVSLETFGNEEVVPTSDRREFVRESVSELAISARSEVRPRTAVDAIEGDRPSGLITARQAAGSRPPISSPAGAESRSVTPLTARDQSDRAVESSASAGQSEPIIEKRPYAPLIPAALSPAPTAATLGQVRRPSADWSQRVVSQSRTADDIEIHIGRIEVTAVQPSAVRAAPAKPQRRAASLDEYLKRRDGRLS